MSIEKMREEFEAWIRSQWPDTYMERIPFGDGRKLEGNYWELNVQISWTVWQASRAALAIELPYYNPAGNSEERRMRGIVTKIKLDIEAAGVKCK